MALKVSVKGERELDRKIKQVRKRLGLSMGEFADEAARSVRDAVVRKAAPFGVGKVAEKKGRLAIAEDLWKVFILDTSGKKRRGTVKNLSEARRIHEARRVKYGRTREGRKHLIEPSVFRQYLEELWKKVGTAKGSVSGGGDPRLKMANNRGWIEEHKGEGKASRQRKIGGAVWIFRAIPRHVAFSRVLGLKGVQYVFKNRKKFLLRDLERKERAELRKAERRVNS